MSTKINYDVLKSLNMGFGSPKKSEESSEIKTLEETSEETSEANPVNENTAPTGAIYLQKRRILNVGDSSNKRLKIDKRPNLFPRPSIKKDIVTKVDPDQRSLYDTEPIVESGPIIETGPVEPYEEDELSDFSDEDEPMKSAAELLSQQFGVEAGYGEEEDYY